MTYEKDSDAAAEALAHVATVPDAAFADLQAQCLSLGADRVGSHAVRFSPEAWAEQLERLPAPVRSGSITRAQVAEVAGNVWAVPEQPAAAVDLFTASYIWGWGLKGYGPARYRSIVDASSGQIGALLQRVLGVLQDDGPIAAYQALRGGDGKWANPMLKGFSAAFFTKFLYFADAGMARDRTDSPRALILDNRVANRVHELCGMPHLVTPNGKSIQWTPYRYAVYLHWMNLMANRLGVPPDGLELVLFGGTGAAPSDDDID